MRFPVAAAAVASLLALSGPAPAQAKDGSWADGVPYTTDFDNAIRQARETGRLLFIYNGWEKPGI